jgi:EAL domain-containing protein (putative c-di-GMP-specific phosphodiesterase class I)
VECNSCLVGELKVEILVEGEENLRIIPDVKRHLNRRNIVVKMKGDNKLVINESGVREFLDFGKDHMMLAKVFFRIGKQEWRYLTELDEILDTQWIDEVILNGIITCHYQPIVNTQQEIYAYEILSRFMREDGSLLYPIEVFSAARIRGRLYALDRLCRMTAVRYAAKINKKAFINFIPTSIYSPEFCLQSTVQLAGQLGVDPSQFVFEVVETEKVDDVSHLKRILAYYKEKGFHYALDDVGEGFSTIELLSDLSPQYMKLDMKYVQGVAADTKKQQVANLFLEKAIKIGSIPLAEGVETKADFEWLKQQGYQLFQGYIFGRPSPDPLTESLACLVQAR